jgi:hypothetical protein
MALIGYNATTPFGAKTAQVVRDLKEAQALVARIVDTMNDITNGGATPANLEGSAQFGVVTGQGQNFYNAIAAFNTALFQPGGTRTPIQASIDLDQG